MFGDDRYATAYATCQTMPSAYARRLVLMLLTRLLTLRYNEFAA